MILGIVVPCYNEQEVISETILQLTHCLEELIAKGKITQDSGIYFVDDGSEDATWQMIKSMASQNTLVHGVKLSKNKGHQHALLAGLSVSKGDAVISIDADLQDDISVIEKMVDAHQKGYDIVYGVRDDRSVDPFLKRVYAEIYYWLLGWLGVTIIFNHADFRLLSRRAIDTLLKYRETNLFLRGLVPQIGFPSTNVFYKRQQRLAGTTKYPLKKSLALAIDGITSFSVVPLRVVTFIGLMVFVISSIMGLWGLYLKLFTNQVVPGWTSIVVPMYFLGAVQLLAIGIIGEYLGKIYLEVKDRPRFIIEEFF